jgi:hypothetical protein
MSCLRFRQRLDPALLVLSAIALLLASASETHAQKPYLLINLSPADEWADNEVGHTVSDLSDQYWTGGGWASSTCEGCIQILGYDVTYPWPPVFGQTSKVLFIPALLSIVPSLYSADSGLPTERAIGQYLAEQMYGDPDYRINLGLDLAASGQVTHLFPESYWPVPVAASTTTIGWLKSHF